MRVDHWLGHGVYSFPAASRFARVGEHRARPRIHRRADPPLPGPVLRSDIPDAGGKHALSFLDLMDLRVVGRFRARNISLPTVRRVYNELRRRLNSEHPFAPSRLVVFGKTVMEQIA